MPAPYAGAARMLLHINGKFTIGNIEIISFVVVSFLSAPHCSLLYTSYGEMRHRWNSDF
jgi:hypothetical protein